MAAQWRRDARKAHQRRPMGTNATILVVDDDRDVRSLVSQYLIEHGYAVIEASDAESAVTVLRGPQPIDLLLTDIVMPGALDGFALAAEAVRLRSDLKVLHVTGYATRANERPELRGRGELLQKPFRRSQLIDTLARLLSSWSVRRNDILRRGYDYWLAKAAGRRYPDRADLDPADITSLLPYLMIIGLEGPPGSMRFRLRLMGEECVAAFGRNVTGCYLDEVLTGDHRDMMTGLCREVADGGRAIYIASSYGTGENGLSSERLLLPFSLGAVGVGQIVLVQTFDWKDRSVSVHRLLEVSTYATERIEHLPDITVMAA